jgi:hypothetical protein
VRVAFGHFEAAELAAVVHERTALGDPGTPHLAHDDVVVPRLVRREAATVKVNESPFHEGKIGFAFQPEWHPDKSVDAPSREDLGDPGLRFGQDTNGEKGGDGENSLRAGPPRQADQNEGRRKGHRGKRRRRDPHGAALRTGRDYGNAAREVCKSVAEISTRKAL